MSKEIIDGVDVSECKYRSDIRKVLLADGEIMTFKNYCQVCNDGCYAIDCYYKQLKRLEQENEENKHYLACMTEQRNKLQTENELLKDANAHLKTELRQRYDEPDFESFRLMGKTIDEWKQLEAENVELKHKNENLKLALSSYELPEVVKVLTDWRTGELQLKENKLNKLEQEKAKYRKSLEEIRDITKMFYNSVLNAIATGTNIDKTGAIIKIQEICSEVLDE